MITVEYTGKYPNLCGGHFIIKRNDIEVYRTVSCFHSIGCIDLDDHDYDPEPCTLKWRADAGGFKTVLVNWMIKQPDVTEIATKFDELMDSIPCCCGGCD